MKKVRQSFELLGVKPDATPEEIEEAHRNSIRQLDQDRLSNDAFLRQRALTKLWELNEAYSVIKAVRRAHLPRNSEDAEKEPHPACVADEGEEGGAEAPAVNAAHSTTAAASAVERTVSGGAAPTESAVDGGQPPSRPATLSLRNLVFAALLFLAGMWTGILIVRETGPLPYEKTAGPERTIRQAAEKGNPRAQAILGAMYYDGEGVARDYRQALNWYRKAAEQGFAEAQYNLGFMYYMGKGVERDRVEARRWFHSAAEQGDAKALDALRGMEGGR